MADLRLSAAGQRRLVRAMEFALVGLLFVGIERGSVGVIVNTGVALLVARLPSVLERDYGITLGPGLALWLTAAAFLHAVGVVGVPGAGWTFYRQVWWWDHVTHSLSASVVAAAGYATVLAFDRHAQAVSIPPRFMSVVILVFVLAFGVAWELLEFAIGVVANLLGTRGILVQYGIEDTLLDLTFNLIGGIIVAIWGSIYLTDLSTLIGERLT